MPKYHVFLSPHYDDAVYSCGGTIHRLTDAFQEVIINTVMGGDIPQPLPNTPIVQELHARWQAGINPVAVRQAEDEAATTRLVARRWLNDVPDCIYRTDADGRPLYPDGDAIFGDIHPADPVLKIITAVKDPLWHNNVHTVYAPLAAGNHVDHQLMRLWALVIKRDVPHVKLLFYEDFPYIREAATVQRALAFFQDKLKLKPRRVILSEADMTAKIEAMALYRSQISTFWESEAAIATDVRQQYTRQDGTLAEIFWTT